MRKGSQFSFAIHGVPLVQVVLGGFWGVLDGFCWLRVTSDGFRVFAVLVVTSISQHTKHLTLYCTHGHTWLTEVVRFFIQSKHQEKNYCCLVTQLSKNKWLFPIFYCVLCQIKNFFQRKFFEKAVTKLKASRIFSGRNFKIITKFFKRRVSIILSSFSS